MVDETIRIGFVGAGANTELRHIPGFQAMDGVELVSVANRSRASGQRVADKYDIPTVYDNWVELIESDDTNAICIGTWPNMHCTLVLAALENEKHVMTEARMSATAEEAHIMRETAKTHPGLITQIVPAPHTLKVDRTLQGLIDDGYLGDILSVDMVVHGGGFLEGERDTPYHWRNDRDFSGYNIMQMGIWYEAMMRWLGPAETVQALTRVHSKARYDADGNRRVITIPDHVEAMCEMYSGPIVRMRFSTVTGLAPNDGVWFFGTEGTIHLDSSGMTLSGGRKGDSGLSEIPIPADKAGGWRVEEEFINAIRGTEPITHTDFDTGVRYMEFMEAITHSAQSGEKIHLPL
ncbi:MAG: Gfo/Idh/MocA family oxidoreductase [Chloroflexi bacterium]|nr:Gfo/Idh/MocA family oxidoreductase [Chloroflexota bacterium]